MKNAAIPKDVEKDLMNAVDLMVKLQPLIREIRLFGSLNEGKWNREQSDIDLSVLVDEDLRFRVYGKDFDEDGYLIKTIDHPDKQAIKDVVKKGCKLGERYSIHIWIPSDKPKLRINESGRGPLYDAIRKGRILYKR